MRIVREVNTKLNSDVSVLRLELESQSQSNTKLNEDFSKLASEMSVLRDIVQELMPL
jgi:predicted nuclease with TOPRIM domain